MAATERHLTPTYVFPIELREVVRYRYPDVNAGCRDEEFNHREKETYVVSWSDLGHIKWPAPPKSCLLYTSDAADE